MSEAAVLDAIQKRIRKYTKKLRSIQVLEKRVTTTLQGLNEDQKKAMASKDSTQAVISELEHLTIILKNLPKLSLEEEFQEIKETCYAQFSNQLDQEIQRLTVNHTTQLQALLKLHQEEEASAAAQAVAQVTDQAAKHTATAVHQAISSLISLFFLSSLFDPWAYHPYPHPLCQHERMSCLTHARHSLTNTPLSPQDFDAMIFLCRTMMPSLYYPFQQDQASHTEMLERCVNLAMQYCSTTTNNTTATITSADDNGDGTFRIKFTDGSIITIKELKEKVDSILKLDYMTAPPGMPPPSLAPHIHPHLHPHPSALHPQNYQQQQQHYNHNPYGTHNSTLYNPRGTPPVPPQSPSSTTTHVTDDSSSTFRRQRRNRPYRSAAPPPATSITRQQQQQQANFSRQHLPQYRHHHHHYGPPPPNVPPPPPGMMMIAPPFLPLPSILSSSYGDPAFAAPTVVKHPPEQANDDDDNAKVLVSINKKSNGKRADSPFLSSTEEEAVVAQQEEKEDNYSNIKKGNRALQFMHPPPPPGILPPPRHISGIPSPCNFKTNEANMDPIIIFSKNAKKNEGASTVTPHSIASSIPMPPSEATSGQREASASEWSIPAARHHPHPHLADIKEGNPGEEEDEERKEEGKQYSEDITRPTPFTFHTKLPLSNSPPPGLNHSSPPLPHLAMNDAPPGLSASSQHHHRRHNSTGSRGKPNSAGKKSLSGEKKTSSSNSNGSCSGSSSSGSSNKSSGSGKRHCEKNPFDSKVIIGGGNDNSHQYTWRTSRPRGLSSSWKVGGSSSQAAVQAALAGIDKSIWKQL
jgi:uncharacterized membrane protein YgcG